MKVLLNFYQIVVKIGSFLWKHSNKCFGKLIEWFFVGFVLVFCVGVMLQQASYAAAVRTEALKLANLAAYAVRPIWNPQVELSDKRRIDTYEDLDALHFNLEGRLPNEIWECAGAIIEYVKLAPAETILDTDRWRKNFFEHQTAFRTAVESWREYESRWFWVPFWDFDTTCSPN
jgi:hypothetical protein